MNRHDSEYDALSRRFRDLIQQMGSTEMHLLSYVEGKFNNSYSLRDYVMWRFHRDVSESRLDHDEVKLFRKMYEIYSILDRIMNIYPNRETEDIIRNLPAAIKKIKHDIEREDHYRMRRGGDFSSYRDKFEYDRKYYYDHLASSNQHFETSDPRFTRFNLDPSVPKSIPNFSEEIHPKQEDDRDEDGNIIYY